MRRLDRAATDAIGAEPAQVGTVTFRAWFRLASVLGALSMAAWLMTACNKSKPNELRAPAAARASEARQTGRCEASDPAAVFTLGDLGSEPTLADVAGDGSAADDELQDLPYSVEVGEAVAYPRGFAVGALKASARSIHAMVGLVDDGAASGRIIDLGAVHGAAPPPRLSVAPAGLVVAVADSDASRGIVRLAAVREPEGAAELAWGRELDEGWDPSGTFSVAVNDKDGVLTWDGPERSRTCGRVKVLHFAADTLTPSEPIVISAHGISAEAPRVVSRPGGFWLAWVSRPGCGQALEARRASPRQADEEPAPALDLGVGALEVVGLSANGERSGEPVRITASGAHVIAYDIVALSDGGALLVYRDDTASPGAEQRLVRLAHLGADGTVERNVLEDEAIGAGVPTLLVDPLSSAGSSLWLAVEGIAGKTRLGRLSSRGALLEQLEPEPSVGWGEILAAQNDRLLIGRSRGRSVELSIVACRGRVPSPVSR